MFECMLYNHKKNDALSVMFTAFRSRVFMMPEQLAHNSSFDVTLKQPISYHNNHVYYDFLFYHVLSIIHLR